MPDPELDALLPDVRDLALRHTLQFGVGLHHAGLCESDRALAERLFVEGKAQVLVATDVAGRGLHIKALPFVVNYDFPSNLEQ